MVKTLHSFLSIPTLNTEWLTTPFARLLIQNLVVEERADVRDATLTLWNIVVKTLRPVEGWMEAVITQNSLFEWYSLAMTPLGVPMDTSTLYHPSVDHSNGNGALPERHNVDKNMLAQDLALISVEIVIKARIATAKAFATVLTLWPTQEPQLLPPRRP